MEKRFETREREIEQDAIIDKKALARTAERLDRFLTPYWKCLQNRANCYHTNGLLADAELGKSSSFRRALRARSENYVLAVRYISRYHRLGKQLVPGKLEGENLFNKTKSMSKLIVFVTCQRAGSSISSENFYQHGMSLDSFDMFGASPERPRGFCEAMVG